MRDIFEIIEKGKKTMPKTNINSEEKIDLSSYIITPEKSKYSKKELYEQLEFCIGEISKGHSDSWPTFKQTMAYALGKKLDFSKSGVKIFATSENTVIDLALYEFLENPKEGKEILKYLIANVNEYQQRYENDNRLFYLLFNYYDSPRKDLVADCVKQGLPELIWAYKFLLQNGAQSRDAYSNLFVGDENPLVFENAELLDILLKEKDPEIIKELEKAFYISKNSQKMYSLFKQHNFTFNPERALGYLNCDNCVENINFLISKGDFKKDFYSEVEVQKNLATTSEYFKKIILEKVESINKQSQQTEKKYTNKKTLSAQEQIDKILNQAIENQA